VPNKVKTDKAEWKISFVDKPKVKTDPDDKPVQKIEKVDRKAKMPPPPPPPPPKPKADKGESKPNSDQAIKLKPQKEDVKEKETKKIIK